MRTAVQPQISPGPYGYNLHFPGTIGGLPQPGKIEIDEFYDFRISSIQFQPQEIVIESSIVPTILFKIGDALHDYMPDWVDLRTVASEGFWVHYFPDFIVFPQGTALVMQVIASITGGGYTAFPIYLTAYLDGEYGRFV